MATQNPQHYVVFVCWDPVESRQLSGLDEELKTRPSPGPYYYFVLWDWSGDGGRPGWRQRLLAPVAFRARKLQSYLRTEPFRAADPSDDPEITLVAQGKACRVVKSYLLGMIEESEAAWRDRNRIRQAIFVAPSSHRRTRTVLASAIALALIASVFYGVSKLDIGPAGLLDVLAYVCAIASAVVFAVLPLLLSEEAARGLGFEADGGDLDKRYEELVVNGWKRRAGTWPVPSNTLALETLAATPESADALEAAIAIPKGHKNVYEVALETHLFEVGPVAAEQLPEAARKKQLYDNVAYRTERDLFSRGNHTDETDLPEYDLCYRTSGWMQAEEPQPNLWTKQEQDEWRKQSTSFHYKFRPEPGQTYELKLTVYGGFSQGDRSAHSHIDVCRFVTKIEYVLDLRRYVDAGWSITRPPELYYIPPREPIVVGADRRFPDEDCDCFKTGRVLESGKRFEVRQAQAGVYTWAVYSVRTGGMLGFVFDVAAPEHRGAGGTRGA